MKNRHRAPSWKAIRRGDRYCAPACGGGCTWAEFQRAKTDAAALARRLGPGWRPRVWENMGWHYEVIYRDGYLTVSGGFIAALAIEPGDGGNFTAHAKTPERAIKLVIGKVRGMIAALTRLQSGTPLQ